MPGREPDRADCQRQQQRPEPAHRPRDGRAGKPSAGVGDEHQPPRRPGGEPCQRASAIGPERGDDRSADAEDGGGRHRGSGEQVRRHGYETDLSRQRHDHRSARHLRRRRHGQRLGEPWWHAALPEPVPPSWREQHQSSGRQHGEREPGRGRQRRVEQQPSDGGRCQRGGRDPCPPGGQCQQGDQPHGRRPDDARRWPGQDHEPDQGQRGEPGGQPGPGAGPASEQQHRADHDEHVGAADRDEVREAGGAKVLLQRRIEASRVADREPRQQSARFWWQRGGGRLQAVAQRSRRPLCPLWSSDELRRPACLQHGRREVSRARGGEPSPSFDPLGGQQPAPQSRWRALTRLGGLLRIAGQDQDPRLQAETSAARRELDQPGRDQHGGRPGSAQDPWVAGDGQPRLHNGALLHQGDELRSIAGSRTRRGGGKPAHDAEQRGGDRPHPESPQVTWPVPAASERE